MPTGSPRKAGLGAGQFKRISPALKVVLGRSACLLLVSASSLWHGGESAIAREWNACVRFFADGGNIQERRVLVPCVIAAGAAKLNQSSGAAVAGHFRPPDSQVEGQSSERGRPMSVGGKLFRSLAVWCLTAAVLLACGGVTARAQTGIVNTGGMSSGGFGANGANGGSGLSGGFGGSSGGTNSNTFSFAGGNSGSFAGSNSTGFSGSSGSGSFSGSSSSFSGTSSSYNSSGRGSTTIGGVSNMNFLASSFANPIAGGIGTNSGSTTSSTAFGTPLYSNLVTNPNKIIGSTSGSSGGLIGNSGSGMLGSASTRGGLSGGLGGNGYGQTGTTGDYGIFALPSMVAGNSRYPAGSGNPNPAILSGGGATVAKLAPLPVQMQTDLQGLIRRSDSISAATRSGITFGLDSGGAVVLRGNVSSPAEARVLESLFRFAPGVSSVRNEMTLKGP